MWVWVWVWVFGVGVGVWFGCGLACLVLSCLVEVERFAVPLYFGSCSCMVLCISSWLKSDQPDLQ